MNNQEPFKVNNIDFSKIVYPKDRSNDKKKIILIKYNEKGKLKNFVFQTPTLLNIGKAQIFNGYHEIELALIGKEKDRVYSFINFLNELELKIKSDARVNASNWFNITDENQTINFQKIIRESEDYKTGTIKVKIIKNNDFETVLQQNNTKRIGTDSIPEDCWAKMILECYAVWINSNNDFGIFLRPILISFTAKESYNYKFIEDSDEENDFDVPDTEINNNIFMNINKNKIKNNVDSTSQLEVDNLIRDLQADLEKTSDLDNKQINNLDNKQINNLDILNIDLGTKLSSSESYESTNVDAETSDLDNKQINNLNIDLGTKLYSSESSSSTNIDAETSDF